MKDLKQHAKPFGKLPVGGECANTQQYRLPTAASCRLWVVIGSRCRPNEATSARPAEAGFHEQARYCFCNSFNLQRRASRICARASCSALSPLRAAMALMIARCSSWLVEGRPVTVNVVGPS